MTESRPEQAAGMEHGAQPRLPLSLMDRASVEVEQAIAERDISGSFMRIGTGPQIEVSRHAEMIAAAGMSRLAEPGDVHARALIEVLGLCDAYEFVSGSPALVDANLQQAVSELLESWRIKPGKRHLADAVSGWRARVNHDAVLDSVRQINRLGGGVLTSHHQGWPTQLSDLGMMAPFCLWWRGSLEPHEWPLRKSMVSVVGSRDASAYGNSVAIDLGSGIADKGLTVISGGAYGIDAMAHRGALTVDDQNFRMPTMAVMAGGLDRFYPVGNSDLLQEICARGVLLSETPPGTAPTRWRFLQRNRIIAALSESTVVVEARWRSGALSTAHHAVELGRSLGAVPGPVTAATSQGTLKLIKEGAELIRDAQDVALLMGHHDGYLPTETDLPFMKSESRAHDQLSANDLMLLDALPVRGWADVDSLSVASGLNVGAVLSGLSRFNGQGLAESKNGLWRKRASPSNRTPSA
ncbi:DNA processing protein [Neomicrococcus aestuarii]|uniref:DNA processing protein n=1 Tax=Neomicrococcus aestuarii TaxID=556325 RepID=A0A7W8WY98_9MICC|nr:DNA-processing protein DprA [Neomicrococcus aestuarii]MBB5512106.1 DNA processing protein [Neomicrococcus aestuarii]